MVLEYIPGQNLRDVASALAGRYLRPRPSRHRAVLEALAYAHTQGLLHATSSGEPATHPDGRSAHDFGISLARGTTPITEPAS
jgi:hypothetical protein